VWRRVQPAATPGPPLDTATKHGELRERHVMRIALKECAWERLGDVLVVVCDPSRQIELDDPDGHAETLLTTLATGPWSIPQLRRELARLGVEVSGSELRDALDALDSGWRSTPSCWPHS
jgi:hypothetical protein